MGAECRTRPRRLSYRVARYDGAAMGTFTRRAEGPNARDGAGRFEGQRDLRRRGRGRRRPRQPGSVSEATAEVGVGPDRERLAHSKLARVGFVGKNDGG